LRVHSFDIVLSLLTCAYNRQLFRETGSIWELVLTEIEDVQRLRFRQPTDIVRVTNLCIVSYTLRNLAYYNTCHLEAKFPEPMRK